MILGLVWPLVLSKSTFPQIQNLFNNYLLRINYRQGISLYTVWIQRYVGQRPWFNGFSNLVSKNNSSSLSFFISLLCFSLYSDKFSDLAIRLKTVGKTQVQSSIIIFYLLVLLCLLGRIKLQSHITSSPILKPKRYPGKRMRIRFLLCFCN